MFFYFSGELSFSLSRSSEIKDSDNTKLSKSWKRTISVKHYLSTLRIRFSFQFRCWQRIVSGEDTSGRLHHSHPPGRVSGESFCCTFLSISEFCIFMYFLGSCAPELAAAGILPLQVRKRLWCGESKVTRKKISRKICRFYRKKYI